MQDYSLQSPEDICGARVEHATGFESGF